MVGKFLLVLLHLSISLQLNTLRFEPETLVSRFNGNVTMRIMGMKSDSFVQEISVSVPGVYDEIKISTLNDQRRAIYDSNYWNHYFILTYPNIITLLNVDHRIDGAVIIAIISNELGKESKLRSNPIQLEYTFESDSAHQKYLQKSNIFRTRDAIVTSNSLTIPVKTARCFTSEGCSFGFCADSEEHCALTTAKKNGRSKYERIVQTFGASIKIKKGYIVVEGNLQRIMGSTLHFKIGNRIISTKPISYGNMTQVVEKSGLEIRYRYTGEAFSDLYVISLLSKDFDNPHRLCRCFISDDSCTVMDNSLILYCGIRSITMKKSLRGILQFSIPFGNENRIQDMIFYKEADGVAGYIQL